MRGIGLRCAPPRYSVSGEIPNWASRELDPVRAKTCRLSGGWNWLATRVDQHVDIREDHFAGVSCDERPRIRSGARVLATPSERRCRDEIRRRQPALNRSRQRGRSRTRVRTCCTPTGPSRTSYGRKNQSLGDQSGERTPLRKRLFLARPDEVLGQPDCRSHRPYVTTYGAMASICQTPAPDPDRESDRRPSRGRSTGARRHRPPRRRRAARR